MLVCLSQTETKNYIANDHFNQFCFKKCVKITWCAPIPTYIFRGRLDFHYSFGSGFPPREGSSGVSLGSFPEQPLVIEPKLGVTIEVILPIAIAL